MDVSSPAPDAILRDARLLNSDMIGRHSVKCSFSTRLTGRFYQNNSLERHTFRKSRLVEMQAKKRRLQEELRLEERRVRLLEERLDDTERARDDASGMIGTIERGLMRCQALVRRRQALKLFRRLRHESNARNFVATFFQCRYRGWKGRIQADSRRACLRRKRRDENAAYIQANIRRTIYRRRYLDLLSEKDHLSNQSAAFIQAMLRGKMARLKYLAETSRRTIAAKNLQRIWRGKLARIWAEEIRQESLRQQKEAEKPKRIPLHLRRYSTYGNSKSKGGTPSTKKRDVRMRRRSSDAMIIMKDGRLSSLQNFRANASMGGHDADENDSIASTMTSLSNGTNPTMGSASHRIRRQHSHRSGGSSRMRPPRRTFSDRSNPIRLSSSELNPQKPRRLSLDRRRTISGVVLTHPQKNKPSRERMKSPLQPFHDSDGSDQEGATTRGGQESCGGCTSKRMETDDADNEERRPNVPPRERVGTPIITSEEASLIVQEVLGKTVLCHTIVHSGFDDECSEHEDDLI